METHYKLSNGDVFEVNEQVLKSLEKLGLDEREQEEIARSMAQTAEWLISSESADQNDDASALTARPLANH